jgi:hypothetical protein
MNPDDIPPSIKAVAQGLAVATLYEKYSGQLPSSDARDIADHVIANTWPAIEAHIREQVAQEIEATAAASKASDVDRPKFERGGFLNDWQWAATVARRASGPCPT